MPDKVITPVVKVSFSEIMGHKPGDNCPDTACPGYISEIKVSWTWKFFDASAVCSDCKTEWCLAEQNNIKEDVESLRGL